MISFITKSLSVVIFSLVFIPVVLAQQPSPTPEKPKDDYVTERQFKSKIFEVKYREPSSIASVLRQLGSGFKGAGISANNEFNTVTVRDFPENLVTIEEAIKRLDTPAPPSPNIELTMHVLLASNRGGPSTAAEIPELKDVLTQLRGTLTYRGYEVITSVLQRLTATNRSFGGNGLAQVPGPSNPTTAHYEYHISALSLVPSPAGKPSIQIQEFAFSLNGEGIRGRVATALNLRDGEKVVVGTATINDRAFIVVLIPKIVN